MATEVKPFHGTHRDQKDLRLFSNFAVHLAYEFWAPAEFKDGSILLNLPGMVKCQCSEKAIMLSKAALFGDIGSFEAIARVDDPVSAKWHGRQIISFDQRKWDQYVELVAYAAVLQKFTQVPGLKKVLLGTGSLVLAEASVLDRIWGVGLPESDS